MALPRDLLAMGLGGGHQLVILMAPWDVYFYLPIDEFSRHLVYGIVLLVDVSLATHTVTYFYNLCSEIGRQDKVDA